MSGPVEPASPAPAAIGPIDLVEYPHPALRRVSRPLAKIDGEIREAVSRMFEIMYREGGVGLAANQVALPYRLFVVNATGVPGEGQEMVFVNPVLSRPRGTEVLEEGCLSLPGLRMDVRRPAKIRVQAFGIDGSSIDLDLDGFFARVVQHEFDHIEGRLFTDRLPDAAAMEADRELASFREVFAGRQSRGELPDDEAIHARLDALERARCTV